jgi:predicted lipoprotein with Yx(FWY)xxD motif
VGPTPVAPVSLSPKEVAGAHRQGAAPRYITAGVTPGQPKRQEGMRTFIALLGIVTVAVLAPNAMSAHRADRGTVTAHSSAYGPILFDGRGFVVYSFTKDPRGRSACSGACAKAWPAYIVRSIPRAGAGVRRSLLSTTRRADGRAQATYAGRPLYYYVGDRAPRQILCQNVSEFGGLWLVVRPSGTPVR